MQKLPIPENIPLRWELWRGFGRPELLVSLLFSGVALIGAAIFSAVTHRPGVTGSLVLTAIFAFSVCTGLFTKLENNQSIVDFFLRQFAFQREQQIYFYVKRKDVYRFAQDEGTDGQG